MSQKEFLVYQIIVSEKRFESRCDVYIDTLIRKVIAESQAEAIGKFILETSDFISDKRGKVEAFLLDDLKKIV
jgi:hypothetical protein